MQHRAEDRRAHWEGVYGRLAPDAVSWYQSEPRTSLELIDSLQLSNDAAVIDVGGGASTLVDELVARGFTDVSVLDVSDAALDAGRARIGANASVHWLNEDLLSWEPPRRYDLWHDRAVFHFLVDGQDRERYLRALREALCPGGYVVIATFAPDGPEQCSGLPVMRWSATQLAEELGEGFEAVTDRREEHVTPAEVVQPFTWLAARRPSARRDEPVR